MLLLARIETIYSLPLSLSLSLSCPTLFHLLLVVSNKARHPRPSCFFPDTHPHPSIAICYPMETSLSLDIFHTAVLLTIFFYPFLLLLDFFLTFTFTFMLPLPSFLPLSRNQCS
ncbi:MAG: hypothetical protein JOS17DRAFT_755484 [Linnemannia elongata]|nr:MAG: hypothetical protein JOS17DRAFT_755484 [Linnemannia elongata]